MNERPLVVIYGYTPRMQGIEASLLRGGGLEVVRAEELEAWDEDPSPDLILFDLSQPDWLQVFSRCKEDGSGPVLVGLCPGGEEVTIFPGGTPNVGVVADINRFLHNWTAFYH